MTCRQGGHKQIWGTDVKVLYIFRRGSECGIFFEII